MLVFPKNKPPFSDDYEVFVQEFESMAAGLPFDDDDVALWLDVQGLQVQVVDGKKRVTFK